MADIFAITGESGSDSDWQTAGAKKKKNPKMKLSKEELLQAIIQKEQEDKGYWHRRIQEELRQDRSGNPHKTVCLMWSDRVNPTVGLSGRANLKIGSSVKTSIITACAEEDILDNHKDTKFVYSLAGEWDFLKSACKQKCAKLLQAKGINDLFYEFKKSGLY